MQAQSSVANPPFEADDDQLFRKDRFGIVQIIDNLVEREVNFDQS